VFLFSVCLGPFCCLKRPAPRELTEEIKSSVLAVLRASRLKRVVLFGSQVEIVPQTGLALGRDASCEGRRTGDECEQRAKRRVKTSSQNFGLRRRPERVKATELHRCTF
jgi:hypothetical protein